VLNPTGGNVEVNGRISALLELGAGFNQEYTGIENIYLNGTMIGFTREEIDAKMEQILTFADIGDFVYQPVKTYSSGMFVRLAFAVAINIDPEILIVDEALSVGDVFFQAKCYHKFEEFKKQGKTILFVSHDLSSISKYCDRAILLNKGKKLAEGAPKEMIDLYKKILVNQYDEDDTEESEAGQNTVEDTTGLWKDKMESNPAKLEYGNGYADIIDFAITDDKGLITNTVYKGNVFKIKMKVRFNRDIQDPIMAYTIKDLKGIELTGTNTMIEKVNFGIVKKGTVKEVEFTQKMYLQGGNYLLSLGCTGTISGEFTVYHRLYDVCSIGVVAVKNTVGWFDMNSKVEVK
jgi:teichoic acid transport system ATP-binding protein